MLTKKQTQKCVCGGVTCTCNVLAYIDTTFPTSHAERSPLNRPLLENTAPHRNKEMSNYKKGWKKQRERILFKNESVQIYKGRNIQKQTRSWRGEEMSVHVYVLPSMRVTFPTSHNERSPLKALADANTAAQ